MCRLSICSPALACGTCWTLTFKLRPNHAAAAAAASVPLWFPRARGCMLGLGAVVLVRVPAPILPLLPGPTRPLLRRCLKRETPMASATPHDGGTGKPDAAPAPTPTPTTTPLPQPPEKPLPGDCCGSGCVRCVWDIYFDELDAYDKALAAHAASSGSGGKDDDSADTKPSDGAKS